MTISFPSRGLLLKNYPDNVRNKKSGPILPRPVKQGKFFFEVRCRGITELWYGATQENQMKAVFKNLEAGAAQMLMLLWKQKTPISTPEVAEKLNATIGEVTGWAVYLVGCNWITKEYVLTTEGHLAVRTIRSSCGSGGWATKLLIPRPPKIVEIVTKNDIRAPKRVLFRF
jgi:hypothetical protein